MTINIPSTGREVSKTNTYNKNIVTSQHPHMHNIQNNSIITKPLPSFHMITNQEPQTTLLHHINKRDSPAIVTDAFFKLQQNNNDASNSNGNVKIQRMNNIYPIHRLLLDTGCPHMNTIDPSLASSINGVIFHEDTHPTTITLGDASSQTRVKQYVLLDIVLPFFNSTRVATAKLKFYVLRTGFDVLLGLQDIIQHFRDYICIQLLHAPLDNVQENTQQSALAVTQSTPDLLRPLTTFESEVAWDQHVRKAPEEDIGPHLSVNTSFLHHLSIPYEDHVKQFKIDAQNSISPTMLAIPEIQDAIFNRYLEVWCPKEWHGIFPEAAPGTLPVRLKTLPTLPPFLRQPNRSIPLKLREAFNKEWSRLTSYIYVKRSSPYASNLTVATKKTPPFIRIAGDYRVINQYIARAHEPLPLAQEIVQECAPCKYYLDLDLTNGYHQLPLHTESSELLSVQTSWGQFCPIYLPEGVGPASSSLQSTMREIFFDMPHVHVLMDNLLVGCDSIEECVERLLLILERCKHSGITLKMSKSKIGMTSANFFGIVVGNDSHTLDPTRAQGINDMPYPTNIKQLRGFLGAVNFFLKYLLPQDAQLTYPLYEATSLSFAWTEDNIVALREHVDRVKEACTRVLQLNAPNYNLAWILRTDASTVGCGAVLLQQNPHDHADFPDALIPIATCSHKFSGAATRWSTIEQEAYAIFWAITVSFSKLLFGKQFIVETDHNNLRWMESSSAPKIIRWRLALQEFDFRIIHIKGKDNEVADHFSRMCVIMSQLRHRETLLVLTRSQRLAQDATSATTQVISTSIPPAQIAFNAIHNDRNGHHGASRSYHLLFKFFPGHQIPFSQVQAMCDSCSWCQKIKTIFNRSIEDPVHHLATSPFPHRGFVGVDVLTMPESRRGNKKILVCVAHDTKKVRLFPIPSEDQITVARCLFIFISQEGRYAGFATDPGSVFFAEAVTQLNRWLGLTHRVSLVDRHESNGVERTNRSILEHMKFMTQVDRAIDIWDEPEYIVNVERLLNTYSDYENGISPQELTTGSASLSYYSFLPTGRNHSTNTYLQTLNNYLNIAHEESSRFHKRLIESRKAKGAKIFYEYTAGELVLAKVNRRTIENKLKVVLMGPFRVVKSDRGNIECEHLAKAQQINPVFHISRLIPYTGRDDNEAFELAMRDDEQHLTKSIKGYRGDPVKGRMYMTFLVEYSDGELCWVQYSIDLKQNVQFNNYIRSIPELFTLTDSRFNMAKILQDMDKQNIDVKKEFYMDLRALGFTWYDSLKLPDSDTTTYRIKAVVQKGNNAKLANVILPDLNGEVIKSLKQSWFHIHAKVTSINNSFVLVNDNFIQQYPKILDGSPLHAEQNLKVLEPACAGTYSERRVTSDSYKDRDGKEHTTITVMHRTRENRPKPKLIVRASTLIHISNNGSLHPIGQELASAEDRIIPKGTLLGVWPGRIMSNEAWNAFRSDCIENGREPCGNYLTKESVLDSTELFEQDRCPFWYANTAMNLYDANEKPQVNNSNVRTYDGRLLFFATRDIHPHEAIMRPYGRRFRIRLLPPADPQIIDTTMMVMYSQPNENRVDNQEDEQRMIRRERNYSMGRALQRHLDSVEAWNANLSRDMFEPIPRSFDNNDIAERLSPSNIQQNQNTNRTESTTEMMVLSNHSNLMNINSSTHQSNVPRHELCVCHGMAERCFWCHELIETDNEIVQLILSLDQTSSNNVTRIQ